MKENLWKVVKKYGMLLKVREIPTKSQTTFENNGQYSAELKNIEKPFFRDMASGAACRWQILRDGFDSRLEPIAFDI